MAKYCAKHLPFVGRPSRNPGLLNVVACAVGAVVSGAVVGSPPARKENITSYNDITANTIPITINTI